MSKAHWLALTSVPGVGAVTARRLLDRFGTVEAVFGADEADLRAIPRLPADFAARLRALSLDGLEDEITSLADEGIHVLTWDDESYPALLAGVADAPPVLFVRGRLDRRDAAAVAIVGTRQPSPAGLALARRLARRLAEQGVTVVSGLALGIDTAAHQGALEAEGRTLAVLGSGLRVVHPAQNSALAEQIAQRGALLSELAPTTPPRGPALMARDRIVSGLSRVVVVVEAGAGSGSLDTAAKARRQGRAVWAAPGSAGTDELIAAGATLLDPQRPDVARLVQAAQAPAEPPPAPPAQLGLW